MTAIRRRSGDGHACELHLEVSGCSPEFRAVHRPRSRGHADFWRRLLSSSPSGTILRSARLDALALLGPSSNPLAGSVRIFKHELTGVDAGNNSCPARRQDGRDACEALRPPEVDAAAPDERAEEPGIAPQSGRNARLEAPCSIAGRPPLENRAQKTVDERQSRQ